MNLDMTVIAYQPKLAELIHKEAYSRPSGFYRVGQSLLTDMAKDRLQITFLAIVCQQQKEPRPACCSLSSWSYIQADAELIGFIIKCDLFRVGEVCRILRRGRLFARFTAVDPAL